MVSIHSDKVKNSAPFVGGVVWYSVSVCGSVCGQPDPVGAPHGKHFRLDFVPRTKYCSTAKSCYRPQLSSLETRP